MLDRRGVLGGMIGAGVGVSGLAGARAQDGAAPAPHIAGGRASLAETIGRMIVLGFLGDQPEAEGADRIEDHLRTGRIGGVLFLRHNARSRAGVEGLAARFRNAAPNAWMAIDQEGGFVQRLSREFGYRAIARARDVAAAGLDYARQLYADAAAEFAAAGFNMNLAPVADVHMDANAVIGRYDRAYGADAETIAAFCAVFIEAFETHGAACSIKHFPGHGRSSGDSHDGFVDLTDTWSFDEAEPFARLIGSRHAHLMMGGHLIHRRLDPSGAPATFSQPIMDGLLRRAMGFDGAVITDDLDMGAIRDHYTRREAVIRSIQAGNDLLLISNSANPDPDLPQKIVVWVEEAIDAGVLTRARIDEAVARIEALQGRVGRG